MYSLAQMISDPEIICADEPTSGLDSFTALNLIKIFSEISRNRNKTIIISIHQPSQKIFELLHTILLLSKGGYAVYSGKAYNIVSYFSSMGYDCPNNMNPADFFMDLVTDTQNDSNVIQRTLILRQLIQKTYEQTSSINFDIITVAETPNQNGDDIGIELDNVYKKIGRLDHSKRVSFKVQYSCLFRRQFINETRNIWGVLVPLFTASLLGLLIMTIYFGFSDSFEAINDRNLVFYAFLNPFTYTVGGTVLSRMCTEIIVFDREIQVRIPFEAYLRLVRACFVSIGSYVFPSSVLSGSFISQSADISDASDMLLVANLFGMSAS